MPSFDFGIRFLKCRSCGFVSPALGNTSKHVCTCGRALEWAFDEAPFEEKRRCAMSWPLVAEPNDSTRPGEAASGYVMLGRFRVQAIHTRHGAVSWFVSDIEAPRERHGLARDLPPVIRQEATYLEAVSGLEPTVEEEIRYLRKHRGELYGPLLDRFGADALVRALGVLGAADDLGLRREGEETCAQCARGLEGFRCPKHREIY